MNDCKRFCFATNANPLLLIKNLPILSTSVIVLSADTITPPLTNPASEKLPLLRPAHRWPIPLITYGSEGPVSIFEEKSTLFLAPKGSESLKTLS